MVTAVSKGKSGRLAIVWRTVSSMARAPRLWVTNETSAAWKALLIRNSAKRPPAVVTWSMALNQLVTMKPSPGQSTGTTRSAAVIRMAR